MTNMTLAVPEDLKKIMDKHREVRWSEIARQAMWSHAQKIELMDNLTAKSKLTDEDIKKLDKKIKRNIARKYGLIR